MKKPQESLPKYEFVQRTVIIEEIDIEHYIFEDLKEKKTFERYSAKRTSLRRNINN